MLQVSNHANGGSDPLLKRMLVGAEEFGGFGKSEWVMHWVSGPHQKNTVTIREGIPGHSKPASNQ